jgi:predicted transcriptional regulator
MTLNKTSLIEAIQRVRFFTTVENNILQELVKIEENKIAFIRAQDLKEKLNVSRTAIYSSLKNLQLKGCINKSHSLKDSYELNEEKLQSTIDIYNYKK